MPNNDPAALLQRHSSTKMCIMMENLQGWAAPDATSSSSANKCHVRRDRNVLCITSEISAEAGDIGWACYLHVLTMEKILHQMSMRASLARIPLLLFTCCLLLLREGFCLSDPPAL